MQREKLFIRFILRKARINKKNESPIYCRITYRGQRKDFSTGEFVRYEDWSNEKQIVLNDQLTNIQLKRICDKLQESLLLLQIETSVFSLEDIYRKYIGKPIEKERKVVEYYRAYLMKIKQLVGIDIKMATYNKYGYVCDHVERFIQWQYKKKDISLNELTLQFLIDFDYYLKTEIKHKQVTINKEIQRFRKVIRVAYGEGIIKQDPFFLYKAKKVRPKVIYLTEDELKKIEQYEFAKARLERVRDMFVFCCYTGLPYREMRNLKPRHIVKGFDGREWIKITREKTDKELSIPLLNKAKTLLFKFLQSRTSEYLLPRLSNQKFNRYLKEITAIAGIKKRLTHHSARKTFATTVLLYNDIPMEIVSELLGHSSLKITEKYYGKIVEQTVSDKMKALDEKLG